jgi:hypothetical protein
MLPNDEVLLLFLSGPQNFSLTSCQFEMDREDMKHHISMLITEGRLTLAPIGEHPQHVIDIGTGTGTSSFLNVSIPLTTCRYLGYRIWSVCLASHEGD